MPWSASDAKRHKKGLSSEQSSKWAKIADSARAHYLGMGYSEKKADELAIRTANSRTKRK